MIRMNNVLGDMSFLLSLQKTLEQEILESLDKEIKKSKKVDEKQNAPCYTQEEPHQACNRDEAKVQVSAKDKEKDKDDGYNKFSESYRNDLKSQNLTYDELENISKRLEIMVNVVTELQDEKYGQIEEGCQVRFVNIFDPKFREDLECDNELKEKVEKFFKDSKNPYKLAQAVYDYCYSIGKVIRIGNDGLCLVEFETDGNKKRLVAPTWCFRRFNMNLYPNNPQLGKTCN